MLVRLQRSMLGCLCDVVLGMMYPSVPLYVRASYEHSSKQPALDLTHSQMWCRQDL